MPAARRRLRLLLGSALGLILLAPLLSTPASATPLSGEDRAPSIPDRYLSQAINWAVCPFDGAVKKLYPQAPTTNCALIKAPMDWNHPDDHPDVNVAIAQSKAAGTSNGLLVSNPGGPGLSGLSTSAALAIDKPQMFADFDLLGFDPRGFGSSTRLQCLTTPERLQALPPIPPDRRERTEQTHQRERAEATLLADACSATEFGQFVSTQQTVYDMELIRRLLTAPKLNYIGYSYGTWLGAWYADTYPTKVDRFVLDSNMDVSRSHWQNMNLDPFSAQRRRDAQLFSWIARNAKFIDGLGDKPAQVKATYETIRGDLVALVKAGRSSHRGDVFDDVIYVDTYNNVRFVRAALDILVMDEFVRDPSTDRDVDARHVDRAWARLSPELQKYDSLTEMQARYGIPEPATPAAPMDAAELRLRSPSSLVADAAHRAAAEATTPNARVDLGAMGNTVRCNDSRWRKGGDFYLERTDRNAARYPFIGWATGLPMCAYWPYPAQERSIDLRRSPTILMIQSELDPATAWEGANRTHRVLRENTRLVSIDDEGQHGQYIGGPSACAEEIGDAYLFGRRLPRRDRVCDTSPLPGETAVFGVDGPLDGNAVGLHGGRRDPVRRPNPMLQKILDTVAINQQ